MLHDLGVDPSINEIPSTSSPSIIVQRHGCPPQSSYIWPIVKSIATATRTSSAATITASRIIGRRTTRIIVAIIN